MSPSLVSIVIPTFNRAKKLADAVKSVQDQTYENWELIVVDDGSRDNTCIILQEIAVKDSRIRIIHREQNRGAQAARNAGIRAAKGDWIAFLDSDDKWLPQSLELRLHLAETENVDVVHSEAFIIYPGDKMELLKLPAFSGWIYKEVLSEAGPMFQCLLVKRQAFERIGYLDESIPAYQEWDTSIRLAKLFAFGFEAQPTFIYDYRTNDGISRNAKRAGQGYERIVRKHFVDIITKAGFGALWNHYNNIANWYKKGNSQFNFIRCRLIFLVGIWVCPKRIFVKFLSIFLNIIGANIIFFQDRK